ncbi:histone H1.0-like [Narcine bancroftii]|uniref:histone H1.0-like n=1 Tax=Narcine bancroftii TaxID=1343680 RepID=UPI0038320897
MADNSAAKSKRGKGRNKAPAHPKYSEMIIGVVEASGSRSGLSRQAIQKQVKNRYKLAEKADQQIKLSLVRLVTRGVLEKTKGAGAVGSFKMSKGGEPRKAARKPAKKAASPKKSSKAKPLAKAKKAKVHKAVKKAASKPKKAKPAKVKAKAVMRKAKRAKTVKPQAKTSVKKMSTKKK